MHKILKNLSSASDITELVSFLDKLHPEILQESVTSQENDKSFFIHFSYGIKHNYEKIKSFYELNQKYNYKLNNNYNKKGVDVNDLEEIVTNQHYNELFTLELLNQLNDKDFITIATKTDLLYNSFRHDKVEIIRKMGNYPELWTNKNKLETIKKEYLSNLKLTELFNKHTNQDNVSEFQNQCKAFIEKEIKSIEKSNLEFKLKSISEFLIDMSQKTEVFTQDFKEELIGLSLSSPYTKVTTELLKVLFNEKMANYKPEKPLWIHFKNLKNKDILYQFLDNFNYADYWEDKEGVKHFKIDYLEFGLNSMDVKLSERAYSKDNTAKRNVAITKTVLPRLKEYWLNEVDGKMGFTREILKESSIFKGQIAINLPSNEDDCKKVLEKSILLKENDQYIFLDKLSFHFKTIKGIDKAIENDLIPDEVIIKMVEKFSSYNFDKEFFEVLKAKIIERELMFNLDVDNKKYLFGNDKIFSEELQTIHNYIKMQKKFEHIPENKNKKAKI